MTPALIVSEQLRQAIADAVADGRSLRALSRQIDVSAPQLSRFVRGERGLTADTIDRIAEALGLELKTKDE